MSKIGIFFLRFNFSNNKTANNYYKILGLEFEAKAAEIKSKYYQLAKQYHPDRNPSIDAAKKFTMISEAYEVLIDENKRKVYNSEFDFKQQEEVYRYKNKKYSERNSKTQFSEPYNEQDEYFKTSFYSLRRAKRGQDIYERVQISLREAVKGTTVVLKVLKKEVCLQCDRVQSQKCFTCGGKGKISIRGQQAPSTCKKCLGKGFKHQCSKCKGEGHIYQNCQQEVIIKKGITNNTILRKQECGSHGFKHKNGDLYIKVLIKPDPYFKVDGINIRTNNLIPLSVAVLGGNIQVETLYGEVKINIPPGTQSGDQRRLPNCGLPSFYSKQMGDQIVSFRIAIPKNGKPQAVSLFRQLQKSQTVNEQ